MDLDQQYLVIQTLQSQKKINKKEIEYSLLTLNVLSDLKCSKTKR